MKETIELTKELKIKFFQFGLDIYTKSIEELVKIYDYPIYKLRVMKNRGGFCLLYAEFFDIIAYNITESIPELLKYKPKEVFYTVENEAVCDELQFWFPCGQNEERIKIIKEILAELQQSGEKTV